MHLIFEETSILFWKNWQLSYFLALDWKLMNSRFQTISLRVLRISRIHLFEVSTMQSHMTIESWNIFEFPMAQIAFNRFWFSLGFAGCWDGTWGWWVPRRWTSFSPVSASGWIRLLLLLDLLLRLLLLLLKNKNIFSVSSFHSKEKKYKKKKWKVSWMTSYWKDPRFEN